MIVKKEFTCSTKDMDAVITELADEIKNGWHFDCLLTIPPVFSVQTGYRPEFKVTLIKNEGGGRK